ncbi:MAG: hypothetical protein A2Y40_07590 [Candidatus Margulisbacteria bacterium GWF2_35_9]|nr:MAG: hypothetical protein A2Y40_07590 [Candidatus Margulisbacteria bacterium GWF2_35_9]
MTVAFNAQLLVFSKDYRTTGIGLYIMNLLEGLHRAEFPMTIFSSDPNVEKVYSAFSHYVSSKRVRDPYIRILWEQTVLPILLQKSKTEVFHSPMHVLPMTLSKKISSVLTIHDLANFRYPQFYKGAKQKYLTTMTHLSAKKADRIIAVSESTKKDLVSILGIKESKIDVVYNGLNLNIEVGHIDEEKIRRKLELPEEYILFVGTMEPRKNIDGILSALLLLWKEKKESYNVVIAGPKGWLYSDTEKKIKEYQEIGQIMQTGYLSDEELVVVYKYAKLFVYPSFYEGFGFPILEAMALGVPVICSETSSMPEVGGDAVEYVDPKSSAQIAEKISVIYKDSKMRAVMKKEGLKQSKLFSWIKSAEQTINVYNKL